MWPFNPRKKPYTKPKFEQKKISPNPEPDLPQCFGYKTTWWAFSAEDIFEVADAVGLVDAQPCNWKTGIEISYESGVFVCPPIEGWILVTGFKLSSGPECLESLLKLSLIFNDAQSFGTHRVVEYQTWARAINGELYRGFGYLGESGEILWDAGDNSTEMQLGLNFPTDEDLKSSSTELDDFDYPGECDVMQIAGKWSISPVGLDAWKTPGAGLIGTDAKVIVSLLNS